MQVKCELIKKLFRGQATGDVDRFLLNRKAYYSVTGGDEGLNTNHFSAFYWYGIASSCVICNADVFSLPLSTCVYSTRFSLLVVVKSLKPHAFFGRGRVICSL